MGSNNYYEKNYVMPNQKSLGYITNDTATFHISEGTVRSGKTTDNIAKFAKVVEDSPDRVFLAIGQTQATAKTILFDGDGLGLEHYPDWQKKHFRVKNRIVTRRSRIRAGKYKGSDALILEPIKGSGKPRKFIVAFGGMKTDSHTTYRGWSVGAFIATQWELLHANTRSELIKRTIASRYRKHILDLNPTAPEHEIYKEFERWERESTVNYIHKTLVDNPILTEQRIKEIMAEYDPESIDYQRDILGLRVSAEGLIYTVRDYNIFNDIDLSDYSSYIITADIGENMSATVFQLQAFNRVKRSMDVLREYYHRNADVKRDSDIKLPNHYAIDFCEFINDSIEYMGIHPIRVQSDLDVTFMREFDIVSKDYGLGDIRLRDVIKKEIDERISSGIVYLYKEKLRFHDSCEHTIEAFEQAVYDPKQKDRGKYVRLDNPTQQTKIDPIDTAEYGFTYYERELRYGEN